MKDDPTLVGQLTRTALLALATHSVKDLAQHQHITTAQAHKLSSELAVINLDIGFRQAMEGERAFGTYMFDTLLTKGLCGYCRPGVQDPNPKHKRSFCWVTSPFIYANELAYLEFMAKLIEHWNISSRELKARGLLGDEVSGIPRYAILTKTICPMLSHVRLARDRALADIFGTRIFLAVLSYKNQYGMYPPSLEDIRTKLSWEMPKDTFSGQDFIYKRQDNGFILYSVGQNMKDDGGQPMPAQRTTIQDSSKLPDDRVWQINH